MATDSPDLRRSGPSRYLVTGGAGFVGASLVRALETRGDRVTVVDAGRAAGYGYLDGTRAQLVQADLGDVAAVARALDGVTAVVHLAARTSVPASIAAPLEDMEQNVVATVRLLDACRARGIDRVIVASSNAAVGLAPQPVSETTPPHPVAPYGAAKLAIEGYVSAYRHSYGMATAALRFSNAYGPYSLHKGSVVSSFIRAALAGEPLRIYGDGTQTRDVVHVDDLVRVLLLALDAPAQVVAGEVFQAGTGVETSIGTLADTVAALSERVIGRRPPIEHLPPRHGDVARSFSDISLARRALGYEPTVTLESGLARTIAWFGDALGDPRAAAIAAAPASGAE